LRSRVACTKLRALFPLSEIHTAMSSKLESFLAEKKIDRRQLLAVSRDLESLRPEDRALRLARRAGAAAKEGGEGDKKDAAAKETRKPRSGKPVSLAALGKILAGKSVSGPTKTRVLRAVNAILERKKQTKVELSAIFDLAAAGAGAKKKKAEKKE
jgi:hypothetical protein